MSQKFKFKLQGVLRLKELAEDQIKNQLGIIIGQIDQKSQLIIDYKSEIQFYFDRYEVAENSKGEMLGGLRTYMPEFSVSHYQKIKKCNDEIEKLNIEKINLIKKLSEAKGQVKIFTNLKDKKYAEYKYKYDKKMHNEIEELTILKGSPNDKF